MSHSLRKAINEMCKQCIYDPYSRGTWLQQVRECSTDICPLHPVRPGLEHEKKPRTEAQIAASRKLAELAREKREQSR